MSNLYRISELIRKAEQADEEIRKQIFTELESLTYKLQAVTKGESRKE